MSLKETASGDDHDKEQGDSHLKSKEGGLRTVWGQPGLHSKSEASQGKDPALKKERGAGGGRKERKRGRESEEGRKKGKMGWIGFSNEVQALVLSGLMLLRQNLQDPMSSRSTVGIEPRFSRVGPGSEGIGEALKCIRFLLGLMKCSKNL